MEAIRFVGIDSFNRPVFKSTMNKRFFGCTHTLFDYDATEADVLNKITEDDLSYFGSRFGCEPYGTQSGDITIVRKDK